MAMRRVNHLKEIITTLSESDVDFIICGGVALVLHGIERMTMDLDLSVDLREQNLRRFIDAMKKLGLVPRVPVSAESILDPEMRRLMVEEKNALVFTFIDLHNPYRQVDIFITDAISFDSLNSFVDTITIGDSTVKLVTKKKLLEMKKVIENPRDKDLYDIHLLEKILRKSEDI